jgi:hypothetical protein
MYVLESSWKDTFAKENEFALHSNGTSGQGCQMFVFKPKTKIWVNFGGSWNEKSWYILFSFGIYSDNLVYFMTVW